MGYHSYTPWMGSSKYDFVPPTNNWDWIVNNHMQMLVRSSQLLPSMQSFWCQTCTLAVCLWQPPWTATCPIYRKLFNKARRLIGLGPSVQGQDKTSDIWWAYKLSSILMTPLLSQLLSMSWKNLEWRQRTSLSTYAAAWEMIASYHNQISKHHMIMAFDVACMYIEIEPDEQSCLFGHPYTLMCVGSYVYNVIYQQYQGNTAGTYGSMHLDQALHSLTHLSHACAPWAPPRSHTQEWWCPA